jgi:hypothetical protein
MEGGWDYRKLVLLSYKKEDKEQKIGHSYILCISPSLRLQIPTSQ